MRTTRAILFVAFAIARAGVAGAQCRVAAAEPCAVDLHGKGAPRMSSACTEAAWAGHVNFELPDRFADADRNGWHEVVLRIDVDPKRGCGCAVFRVTYEGDPTGFSVNIGDSPTNDGYGGDDWSTRYDAELEIINRNLTAYGAEQPGTPADQQLFGMSTLPIADRVVEFEICDQSVRFAVDSKRKDQAFGGFFNTYRSRDLISIRTPAEADAASGDHPDSRIYAAFNRVIHKRSGRPSQNRFGSGVRRVEISLTP